MLLYDRIIDTKKYTLYFALAFILYALSVYFTT